LEAGYACSCAAIQDSPYRPADFCDAYAQLDIHQRFTRPCLSLHPTTHGKAERFIQTALREWPTLVLTPIRNSGPKIFLAGCTTTTGIARMLVSPTLLPMSRSGLERNNLLRHHS